MTHELVIFDCDGVLVDSEAIVIEIEAAMLSAAGFALSADDIAERYVGLSYTSMMRRLEADFGRPAPDDLSPRIQQAALDAFPDQLQPVAGIEDLLRRSTQPRCIASSSGMHRLGISLGVTGLDKYFDADRVFSAEMVENGKPAPDLFLHAAEQCGVAPASCLVIEDSPHGVQAAIGAGMDVVGFVGGKHARQSLAGRLLEAGAPRVVADAALL